MDRPHSSHSRHRHRRVADRPISQSHPLYSLRSAIGSPTRNQARRVLPLHSHSAKLMSADLKAAGIMLNCKRFAKPLNWETGFGGSKSPLSALDATGSDKTRPDASFPRVAASSTQEHSTPPSRQEATEADQKHPLTATQNATQLLPEDADLAVVNDAWPRLPEAVRASILMLVKAAST